MYFEEFKKKLTGDTISESIRCHGRVINLHIDGTVFIDNEKTDFLNLEEARNYIKQKYYATHLEEQVKHEIYDEISENKIANIINKYHDVKITDTLIESYLDLASSKLFTLDPVVEEIRKLNKFDMIIEGKKEYKLEDGSMVAINNSTNDKLKELFNTHTEVVNHMRQTKENFLQVIKQIGE